jgi:deoxyribodipyrimidine photo-lyase
MPTDTIVIHWFRRDLRLEDNHALYEALKSGKKVLPVFIFDSDILRKLSEKSDARVTFIYQQLQRLQKELLSLGSGLYVVHDTPDSAFKKLLKEFNVAAVYTNHDYEPYAIQRDSDIEILLEKENVNFLTFKDQVIFEKAEVVKDDGKPYTVFTPYSRKWLARFDKEGIPDYPSEKFQANFHHWKSKEIPSLASMGFTLSDIKLPSAIVRDNLISNYDEQRNYPAIDGTSRLGVHLRFGTISIRKQVRKAKQLNAVWLSELIWREFYMMILWHFPHVVDSAFKPIYNNIEWRNKEAEFEKWKSGQTGYPIVDAGMRELAATGYMHNRVRMIVASFLTKHLLIDWRWGEAWFAEKLLDFELASNNGGWQWAAGSGCDAAPYFRIFNPYEQTKKFDADMKYIRKWVPEFEDFSYPKPIVDHKDARERCLRVYSKALKPA